MVSLQPVCLQYFPVTKLATRQIFDAANVVTNASWDDHETADFCSAGAGTSNSMSTKFVGTNACVHCHKSGHANPQHAVAGKEYSIWANSDPHSRAYSVLFDQKSVDISRNLRLQVPPHENDLCLNCHSTNVPSTQLVTGNQHSLADGVGCESCHGGAGQWLVPHKLPEWQYFSPAQKEALGFIETDNLATRARVCAECHVGSPGRDVNHDLIAAGHPRLYFELSAYQSKMPGHWSRSGEILRHSSTAEARLWLIGQFVNAAASLEVLQQRAENRVAPWPEFAEYGCSSCHGDLASKNRSSAASVFRGTRATSQWGTWHYSMLGELITATENIDSAGWASDLEQLRHAMTDPVPDRETVAKVSSAIRSELIAIADQLAFSELPESDVNNLAMRVFGAEFRQNELTWDSLTQRYLAAVALRQSIIDSRIMGGQDPGREWDDSGQFLAEIRESLRFIENYEGPKQLEPAQIEAMHRSFNSAFEKLVQ